MERLVFRHPRLRMSRNPEGLEIILPVNAGKFRRLLDALWLGVWGVVEGMLVATLAGVPLLPGTTPVLVLLTVLFGGAGVFLGIRCLWYGTGRERFVVQPDRLTVARQILGLGPNRTVPASEIRSVRGLPLLYRFVYPSWGRLFVGTETGQIVVEGEHARWIYGKGLELEEARALADLIAQELGTSPQRRVATELRGGQPRLGNPER